MIACSSGRIVYRMDIENNRGGSVKLDERLVIPVNRVGTDGNTRRWTFDGEIGMIGVGWAERLAITSSMHLRVHRAR